MTLECPMGDIEITPKTVKHVLGLPMGRRRLEREGQREYNDPFLLQWKDQFRNVNKLTIKALSDVIIQTKNSDYMFRMNILTLIANTLGSCENSSTVNFTVLKNVFEGDDVSDIDWLMFLMLTYLHYTKFDMLKVKRRLPAFKSWNTSLLKKREIAELQNDYIGIGEIKDDVGEGEEPNQKELLQLKQRMKDIFKEPDMPEYLSSSSSESDDDNDDGSQLADENEESYRKETHSNDEDDVEIIAEVQKDERNETHYTAECMKKDEQETGTSKKDEADNNKEEGMANKKATNKKRNEEINPFDDPKFGEYYIQNEHLFVPTQTSAEKKKDQTDDVNWDSLLENEEEIIRKGREFSDEIRTKAQQ
ncbi:hypothetical protein Tco_1167053 [Tanacetum coccineum]